MNCLIRQMGYVVVATPRIEASACDLLDMLGLRIQERNDKMILMSSNARHCEIAFVHGDSAGIHAVGLEAIDAAAVDEVLRRANSEHLDILADTPSVSGVERAVRFATSFGPIFEVHTPVARDPSPEHTRPAGRAKRLDHVNLRADDPRGFHDLVTTLLGLRLSDRTEDYGRAWYRAADGFHHTVAAGMGTGLHHYGFDAYTVQDVVDVADGLVVKGRRLLWGLGRHGPGNNIFSYYLDPNGCVVETSFGMVRIDGDLVHEAGVWAADYANRVLDLWGSKPPPDYAPALTPFVE